MSWAGTSGLPKQPPATQRLASVPVIICFSVFINAFSWVCAPPGEIGPSRLTSIPASLIDVFQSPSPCWGAIVNWLAALTLPSGPRRGAWAQLDSPYRLLADTAADWSDAFLPPSHLTAVKL